MKNDRKRLKSEKLELLNQMKEVYQTLESKERELRDFIRQFEQKMRDSDKGIKEVCFVEKKNTFFETAHLRIVVVCSVDLGKR